MEVGMLSNRGVVEHIISKQALEDKKLLARYEFHCVMTFKAILWVIVNSTMSTGFIGYR